MLSLAILLPAVAGYFAMGPTFEALVVPTAYRGEFGPIALALAPGLLCYGALVVAVNPVFQLAGRTWPVTVAAVIALLTDLCLLAFTAANASVVSLAQAYSLSLVVAAVVSTVVAFRRPAMRPNLRGRGRRDDLRRHSARLRRRRPAQNGVRQVAQLPRTLESRDLSAPVAALCGARKEST